MDKFWLAPLRGYTNKEYRYALTKNFQGLESCCMPFISVTENFNVNFKKYEHNFTDDELHFKNNYKLVVQLIGKSPTALAGFTEMLCDNGFCNVNLNLGCPMPQITRKMRGSGLLPHVDVIRQILDNVLRIDDVKFSLKVRLGFKNNHDLLNMTEMLNDYPLDCVIIHPRTATDMYDGKLDTEMMKEVVKLLKHKVIYNGDIVDNESFTKAKSQFPTIDTFMIGRGLLYKPFLLEELLQGYDHGYDERIEKFQVFYDDLLAAMANNQNLKSHVKAYWHYFKDLYKDGEERYKVIVRS